MQYIANDIAAKVEGGKSLVTVLPSWAMSILAIFSEDMSSLKEMLPIWVNDYTVHDSEFAETFSLPTTPYDQALEETIIFFLERKKE